MREIKFRAWDVENKIMIDSDSLAFEEYSPLCELLKSSEYMIFLQYTGLKDENGKEIFEGDILETNIYDYYCGGIREKRTSKYVAKFNLWAFRLFNVIEGDYSYTHCTKETTLPLLIIGNIYENPELLKKTKKDL